MKHLPFQANRSWWLGFGFESLAFVEGDWETPL